MWFDVFLPKSKYAFLALKRLSTLWCTNPKKLILATIEKSALNYMLLKKVKIVDFLMSINRMILSFNSLLTR